MNETAEAVVQEMVRSDQRTFDDAEMNHLIRHVTDSEGSPQLYRAVKSRLKKDPRVDVRRISTRRSYYRLQRLLTPT